MLHRESYVKWLKLDIAQGTRNRSESINFYAFDIRLARKKLHSPTSEYPVFYGCYLSSGRHSAQYFFFIWLLVGNVLSFTNVSGNGINFVCTDLKYSKFGPHFSWKETNRKVIFKEETNH